MQGFIRLWWTGTLGFMVFLEIYDYLLKISNIPEVMEDEVNNLKLDVFTRRQDFEIKYSYFTTIPRTPVVWSSFVAVLTVISFFVLGLILCCCSLMSFGLVEEGEPSKGAESHCYRIPFCRLRKTE